MKSLAPGLQELARLVNRQVVRLRLILDRRRLARLETALGLLGWQQADYDAATQEHVNRLTDCEREQSRLTNDSAALGLEIQRIEEERGVRQREFSEAQASALERAHPTVADLAALEELVMTKRKEGKEIEACLPVLDRELSVAEEQYRTLVLQEKPSSATLNELLRLRKLILALPAEKAEWRAKQQQTAGQAADAETLLTSLREARERFEKKDEESTDAIASHQRAKRKLEKEIDTLEKAKSDPYREIGRSLADHDIAPLNQPHALVAVLEQRRKIEARESAIAASLAISAQARPGAVLKTWLFAGGLVALGVVAVLAIVGQ